MLTDVTFHFVLPLMLPSQVQCRFPAGTVWNSGGPWKRAVHGRALAHLAAHLAVMLIQNYAQFVEDSVAQMLSLFECSNPKRLCVGCHRKRTGAIITLAINTRPLPRLP